MDNGYAYLLHRHSAKIRFLCSIECSEFSRGVDPRKLKCDRVNISRIRNTFEENKFDWELCVENGTIEQIIEKWKSRGRKVLPGRHVPEIKPTLSGTAITKTVTCGTRQK